MKGGYTNDNHVRLEPPFIHMISDYSGYLSSSDILPTTAEISLLKLRSSNQ